MSQETKYEKRTWVKGDRPGASDFNRIEDGIESAHEEIKELKSTAGNTPALEIQGDFDLLNSIEYLPDGSKVADVVVAFNQLLATLKGDVEGGEIIE